MFILQREDGKFVAPSGSEHSYTDRLQSARLFKSEEEARRDKCGNERLVPLTALFGR